MEGAVLEVVTSRAAEKQAFIQWESARKKKLITSQPRHKVCVKNPTEEKGGIREIEREGERVSGGGVGGGRAPKWIEEQFRCC